MNHTATDRTPSAGAGREDGPEGRHGGELDEAADIVASMSDATLLRSVAAVIVGFIVLTLGSVAAGRLVVSASGMEAGASPTGEFLTWSLVSRFGVALLAGYLTARAAPRRPMTHAAVLAGLVAFLALAAMWGLSRAGVVQDPAWYPTAMLLVGPGGVLAGGGLRARSIAAAIVAGLAVGLAGCAAPADRPDAPEPPAAAAMPPDAGTRTGTSGAATGTPGAGAGPAAEDTARILRGERNFLTAYPAIPGEDEVHVVIEIPAGTSGKWETTKDGEAIAWELLETGPRVVRYLAYPANYGMIPRTLLPEPMGGDGDPLDVVLLGPAIPRGSVVRARPVGVLELRDTGEEDDKLLAVPLAGLFSEVRDLDGLRSGYAGVLEIIETWFASYKGPGVMEAGGMRDAAAAHAVIDRAAEAFEAYETCGDLSDAEGHGPDPFGEEWWTACRARMGKTAAPSGF